jgi:hypothetical protein
MPFEGLGLINSRRAAQQPTSLHASPHTSSCSHRHQVLFPIVLQSQSESGSVGLGFRQAGKMRWCSGDGAGQQFLGMRRLRLWRLCYLARVTLGPASSAGSSQCIFAFVLISGLISPALGPEVHLSEQWTSGKVHEPVTSSPRHFYSRASESEVRPEAVG